jgi:1-aminocyclopropane-1-carboxylate deaminase/D-cysteine desulfhydrase-like pyridoxal-dependent ACC family enzyme
MFGTLLSLPSVPLAPYPTPVEELSRLRAALGGGPRLFVKRDDAIGFAFGGNKVRKMRLVAAEAQRLGADTLITSGGVQSNHARVTAAAAARLGMRSILVANGSAPERLTANALLDSLLGAEIRYVSSRDQRAAEMEAAASDARASGHRPFVIPIGASTPLGAAGFVQAVAELLDQIEPPTHIVHATSSGGTQAGLVAGCALAGIKTKVIGISADEPAPSLERDIRAILDGLPALLGLETGRFNRVEVKIDDAFVGGGYGVPTDASREAIVIAARAEALFLDPVYTAKAMAGLMAYFRRGFFQASDTVLFWHTGGQVGLFA